MFFVLIGLAPTVRAGHHRFPHTILCRIALGLAWQAGGLLEPPTVDVTR